MGNHYKYYEIYNFQTHLFLLKCFNLKKLYITPPPPKSSTVAPSQARLCDVKFGCPPGEDVAGEDYVSDLRRKMENIHQRVRHNIQSASDRMKEFYDVRAENGGYRPGDLVWLYNPQRRRGFPLNYDATGKVRMK